MKIAIIGAGKVGTTLGKNWSSKGHEICYGTRNPQDEKHSALKEYAEVTAVKEASSKAEVIVLATPWSNTEAAILEMGNTLDGKILIDSTNPFKPDMSGLTHSGNDSGAEQVARWAPKAKVVKAINCAFASVMANPEINGVKATLLIARDDEDALQQVAMLTNDLGFNTQKMKGLANSRLIEMVGLTLVTLAFKEGLGPNFGFTLLKN